MPINPTPNYTSPVYNQPTLPPTQNFNQQPYNPPPSAPSQPNFIPVTNIIPQNNPVTNNNSQFTAVINPLLNQNK